MAVAIAHDFHVEYSASGLATRCLYGEACHRNGLHWIKEQDEVEVITVNLGKSHLAALITKTRNGVGESDGANAPRSKAARSPFIDRHEFGHSYRSVVRRWQKGRRRAKSLPARSRWGACQPQAR